MHKGGLAVSCFSSYLCLNVNRTGSAEFKAKIKTSTYTAILCTNRLYIYIYIYICMYV
jgi:hypothetical protein